MFETVTRLFNRFGRGDYNGWEVTAELVLIGLSVNWCAGVLHGTRGTRLLRGLLVVLIAATLIVRVLAEQFHWSRLELLYRYFVIGLAFIALIAFQPELRRALIRAGDVRFLKRAAAHGKVIPALIEAIGYLARNKFGALIAIQRDVGLANWAENGTSLNSEVAANLLKTIFFPNSALHDLGVIIRGNRILAAACQFPMAESGELDPGLGGRHRAAVGLSMESDALVLVVSEETGTISIADQGRLTRFESLAELEQDLDSRLSARFLGLGTRHPAGTVSDLWRFMRRLLVVIPVTLVIWALADQASLIPAEDVPLRLNILHDNTVHVDLPASQPTLFRLDVRGPTRQIELLRAAVAKQPLVGEWQLPPGYPAGSVRVEKPELLEVLSKLTAVEKWGVFVEDVSPESLEFEVQQVVSVDVPVHVASGALRIELERVEPETVRVWLRQSDRDRIEPDQLFVTVDLQNRLTGEARNQTLEFDNVPLLQQIGAAQILRMAPAQISVQFRIVAERATRSLKNIQVRVTANPQIWQNYRIEFADVNEWLLECEIEGDRTVIDQITGAIAYVPVTSEMVAPPGEFRTAEIVLELPKGVSLIGPNRVVQLRLVPREGVTP